MNHIMSMKVQMKNRPDGILSKLRKQAFYRTMRVMNHNEAKGDRMRTMDHRVTCLAEDAMRHAVDTEEVAGLSVLVMENGEEILYREAGFADKEQKKKICRDSIFRLYSQTKPITAVSVFALVERGKLDLMEDVRSYLPGFSNQKVSVDNRLVPVNRPVTVLDLLGMMSGLPYPDADIPGQAMGNLFSLNEAQMSRNSGFSTVEFANRIGSCPLSFQPGTAFRYGTSADVLGAIVEIASGMPFADFLRETIFEPLEMKDTAFYVPEEKKERLVKCYERAPQHLIPYHVQHLCVRDLDHEPSFVSGGAGLMSTLDDYAAFATMLLQGGIWHGRRILREETVRWMIQPQIGETGWQTLTGFGYGRLMRVCTDPGRTPYYAERDEYGWDGWLGTYFANLPGSGRTMLFFQNTKDTGTGRVTRCLRNILM